MMITDVQCRWLHVFLFQLCLGGYCPCFTVPQHMEARKKLLTKLNLAPEVPEPSCPVMWCCAPCHLRQEIGAMDKFAQK